jgi:hypothetical protein
MVTREDVLIRIQAELGDLKKELREVQGSVKETTAGFEKLSSIGKGLVGSVGLVGGLAAIGTGLFKAAQFASASASEFESLQARLTSLYGSASKGAEVFAKLSDVAKTTPFELADVVEAGVTLKAFGVNAEDTTKSVADLAAFMGTTATEAAQALGRAFAGGAGAADVLRDRGILNLIKSFKGIEDLTKLTLPEFRDALISTMSDPAAGIAGSTDLLARTFAGTISNMKDSLAILWVEVGEKLNPMLQGMASALSDSAKSASDFLDALSGKGVDTTIAKMRELGMSMGPILRAEIRKAQEELTKLWDTRPKETVGLDDFIQVDTGLERIRENNRIIEKELKNIDEIYSGIEKQSQRATTPEQLAAVESVKYYASQSEEAANARIGRIEKENDQILARIDLLNMQAAKEKLIYDLEVDLENLGKTRVDQTPETTVTPADQAWADFVEKSKDRVAKLAQEKDFAERLKKEFEGTARALGLFGKVFSADEFIAKARERGKAMDDEAAAIERLKSEDADLALKLGYIDKVMTKTEFVKKAQDRAAAAKQEKQWIDELSKSNADLALAMGWITKPQTAEEFVKASRDRAAAMAAEETNLRALEAAAPAVAAALGLMSSSTKDAMDKLNAQMNSMKGILLTFATSISEALAAAWTAGTSGLRDALKNMLFTILSAIEQMMLQAKIAAIAKAFIEGGVFNLTAGLAAMMKAMPGLVAMEAMFAAAKVGISKFEHGGVVDRPTLALMGEAVQRSGPEVIAPRTGFKRELRSWMDEVGLPAMQSGGLSEDDRGLLREIRDALQPTQFGRSAGRAIGRELAVANRGLL